MKLNGSGLFPARYLGFGFFWAWLFLVDLSPSPLFGRPLGIGGIPFEMSELSFRLVVLLCTVALAPRFATQTGRHALAASAFVCCTSATVLLAASEQPQAIFGASALAAVGETSLFLLWMTFFGYMKLGETLALLVVSYATGAVLCLAAIFAGQTAMVAMAVVLPAASCAAFVLSGKYYAAGEQTKSQLFESAENTLPPARQAVRVHMTRPLAKMTAGLALYSFAFSLYLGIAAYQSSTFSKGFVIEPVSAIMLAAFAALAWRFAKTNAPYRLYQAVAPLLGIGFALLALGVQPMIAGVCVTLGYLLFEVLAYNDFCNIVKADDASLFKTIAFGRMTSSFGMIAGWAAGFALAPAMPTGNPVEVLSVSALAVVLLTATLAFTDHDRETLRGIADDRAAHESKESLPDRAEAIAAFAEQACLSPREGEVLEYLLAGRTTAFAAEKLFVAESTVRAHVHNIYRKVEAHSRMELLDEFERFRHELGKR